MKTLEATLNEIGQPGDTNRLREIAKLNLGERSEAAKRVLIKRERRLSCKHRQYKKY